MTPHEINVALAEWMGWTFNPLRPPEAHIWCGGENWKLPDFYHDLSAVHVAEMKILQDHSCHSGDTSVSSYYLRCISPVATAPQRCEALLRTLGLWKEGV